MWFSEKKPKSRNYFEILNLPVGVYDPRQVSEAMRRELDVTRSLPLEDKKARVNEILSILDSKDNDVTRYGIGPDYVALINAANEKKDNRRPLIQVASLIMGMGGLVDYLNLERAEEIGANYQVENHRGKFMVKSPDSQFATSRRH